MANSCTCYNIYQNSLYTGKDKLARDTLRVFTNGSSTLTLTLTIFCIPTLTSVTAPVIGLTFTNKSLK